MQTNHYFGQSFDVARSETTVGRNKLPNVEGEMSLA